jgi:hypothetical protein
MKRHHLNVLYLQKSDNRAVHVDFGIDWLLVLTCANLRNLHLIQGSFFFGQWRLMKISDAPQELGILVRVNTHHIEIAHGSVFLGEHYVVVFV